jgi:hypothetical protein
MPFHMVHVMRHHGRGPLRKILDRKRRPSKLVCNISAIWALRARKDFCVFSADQQLRGITVMRRECLLGGSSVTRNFRQNAYLCSMEASKLRWNEPKPQGDPPLETTSLYVLLESSWNEDSNIIQIFNRNSCTPFEQPWLSYTGKILRERLLIYFGVFYHVLSKKGQK